MGWICPAHMTDLTAVLALNMTVKTKVACRTHSGYNIECHRLQDTAKASGYIRNALFLGSM